MTKVTEDMKQEIQKYFHEGLPLKEIAKRLNISYKTLSYYLRQMGLRRQQKTTIEKKMMIKALYEAGTPINKISKIVGISRSKVFYHLKKMDVKKRHQMPSKMKLTIKIPKEKWKLAYIAGIIDGEGTISVSKSRFGLLGVQPYISVKNTNKNLLKWLQKEVGGHVKSDKKYKSSHKDRWYWRINCFYDVYHLIKAVEPFLIVKKIEAKKVLQICERRFKIEKMRI